MDLLCLFGPASRSGFRRVQVLNAATRLVEKGELMKIRALFLGVALPLAFAADANATIIGSTYEFSTSVTGSTQISPLGGPTVHTDPANPGFCVGPPVACDQGAGVSGSFAFSTTANPDVDRITFTFFGSTDFAPGTFTISLGNFVTTDGQIITGVTYNSGNLFEGNFTSVAFNGTTATFTGSTGTVYDAIGGSTVAFDVATRQVPEPATLALFGTGLLALAARRRRRNRA
jgi:hypothetical protein